MKTTTVLLAAVMVAALATGCTKKVQLTVANYSDSARTVQLTVPEGTSTLGTVGPNGGRLTSMLTVKTSDLPADANLSAGSGASTNFPVTEDTAKRLWFRITQDGRLAGPYGKDDQHTETYLDTEIKTRSEGQMIVR